MPKPARQIGGEASLEHTDHKGPDVPPVPAAPGGAPVNMWDCIDAPAPVPSASLPGVPAPSAASPAWLPAVPAAPDRGVPRPAGSAIAPTGFGSHRVADDDGRAGEIAAPGHRAAVPAPVRFPVGWLTVIEGPGRGTCFALEDGVSQIGRGADQAIALDFGDTTISLQSHASIAYDAETHAFHVGHGGNKDIVRLNGRPVLAAEPLESFDLIRIGETTLVFVALCSADFNWDDAGPFAGKSGGAT